MAVYKDEARSLSGQEQAGQMVAHRPQHAGGRRPGRQQRVPRERLQVEIAPTLALAARKTGFGKAGEPAPAVLGERRGIRNASFESVEIGPRLGLHREIDDRAHQAASPAVASKVP